MPCFMSLPCQALRGAEPVEVQNQPAAEGATSSSRGCLGTLKDNWRTVPVIVIIAALIIGIAISFIWNQPYLSIPFGIGIVCAFFLMYIAHNYKHLQGFGKNNEVFAASNKALKTEVVGLRNVKKGLESRVKDLSTLTEKQRRAVARLGEERTKLGEERAKFEQEGRTYREQNLALKARCEDLGEKCNTLEGVLGGLQGLQGEQSATAANLRGQVGRLRSLVEGENSDLAGKLTRFNEMLSTLGATGSTIREGTLVHTEALRAEVGKVQQFTQVMQELVPQIIELAAQRRADAVREVAAAQVEKAAAQADLAAARKARSELDEASAREREAHQRQIARMQSEIAGLEAIRDSLDNTAADVRTAVSEGIQALATPRAAEAHSRSPNLATGRSRRIAYGSGTLIG